MEWHPSYALKPLDLLGMGHVDDRALAAADPAAHANPRAPERASIDALGPEDPQRVGLQPQAERGAPVATEIDEELALDHGRVGHGAFDDLEAAGVAAGLVGRSHGVEAVAPDAAPRLPRAVLAPEHLGHAPAGFPGPGAPGPAPPGHRPPSPTLSPEGTGAE